MFKRNIFYHQQCYIFRFSLQEVNKSEYLTDMFNVSDSCAWRVVNGYILVLAAHLPVLTSSICR